MGAVGSHWLSSPCPCSLPPYWRDPRLQKHPTATCESQRIQHKRTDFRLLQADELLELTWPTKKRPLVTIITCSSIRVAWALLLWPDLGLASMVWTEDELGKSMVRAKKSSYRKKTVNSFPQSPFSCLWHRDSRIDKKSDRHWETPHCQHSEITDNNMLMTRFSMISHVCDRVIGTHK